MRLLSFAVSFMIKSQRLQIIIVLPEVPALLPKTLFIQQILHLLDRIWHQYPVCMTARSINRSSRKIEARPDRKSLPDCSSRLDSNVSIKAASYCDHPSSLDRSRIALLGRNQPVCQTE